MALGDELIVNGGFDTNPTIEWNVGTGWHWTGTENPMAYVGFAGGVLSQKISGESQSRYHITFTISEYNHTGTLFTTVQLADAVYDITGDGDYSFDTPPVEDDPVLIFTAPDGESFIFRLDNVSVREVLPDVGPDEEEIFCLESENA
jgi:hypothetical protein